MAVRLTNDRSAVGFEGGQQLTVPELEEALLVGPDLMEVDVVHTRLDSFLD